MANELITTNGYKNFVDEFNHLLKKEKPYWVKEKEIAAQFGDRSENAEYISAKEQLRNIDKRLRYLNKIINNSTVIDTSTLPQEKVNFGSQVTLFDFDKEEEKIFIIVGTYETDPFSNKISNKSPLGKALFGRKIDEEFEFIINNNIFEYQIVNIEAYDFNKMNK